MERILGLYIQINTEGGGRILAFSIQNDKYWDYINIPMEGRILALYIQNFYGATNIRIIHSKCYELFIRQIPPFPFQGINVFTLLET